MRYTPIAEQYEKYGGRIVDFHGWGLPVQFSGIITEHLHVRSRCGVFDCSHMGEFLIRGDIGIRILSDLVIGDIIDLPVQRCRYTAILNEDGGIIDDCVALKLTAEEVLLVTNAGPLEEVSALLTTTVSGIEDISDKTAKIDVQGPYALDVLRSVGFGDAHFLKFWNGYRRTDNIIIARAGYSGELGYELYVPADDACTLWRTIVEHPDVLPCGLGARDTLRTEMGYPLNGQDVSPQRTPLEAGMNRFIAWNTPFPGKSRIVDLYETGEYQVLVALRSVNRRAPRPGYILSKEDCDVGVVTSGTFGPSLGIGIGLGYVPRELAVSGTEMQAGPRKQRVIVEMPPLYKQGSGRKSVT